MIGESAEGGSAPDTVASEIEARPPKDLRDAEIDAAVASDPDWAEFEPIDRNKAEVVVPPKKQAISIRLDQDLVDFFKKDGPGYQRRINAVLRGYMRERLR